MRQKSLAFKVAPQGPHACFLPIPDKNINGGDLPALSINSVIGDFTKRTETRHLRWCARVRFAEIRSLVSMREEGGRGREKKKVE